MRIDKKLALNLLKSNDIITLGELADSIRKEKHGNNCYFSLNININPTNICKYRCSLCAFSKDPDDGYLLSIEEIEERVKKAYNEGIKEVHIVGGCNPSLDISYYEEIFLRIRKIGNIFIQGLTAIEINHLAERSGIAIKDALICLKNAGLGSIAGGGAEIFSDRVRAIVAPKKPRKEIWLSVMKEAHDLKIKSNATMLFGTIEDEEEIIEHLFILRKLQDKTSGFLAFVPLVFHPKNTKLSHLKGPDGVKILKIFAISRIVLDNFPHIKGLWTYLDRRLLPIALNFGIDDIGGTSWDERIVRASGGGGMDCIKKDEFIRIIKDTGRTPICVNSIYQNYE